MYETGVVIAFFFWLISHSMLIGQLNSIYAYNLGLIGLKQSVWSGEPFPVNFNEDDHFWRRVAGFILSALIGLILVATSWIYVAAYIIPIFYKYLKGRGAPPEVRQFSWSLRNLRMSREQVIEAFLGTPHGQLLTRERLLNDLRERGYPV